MKQRSDLALREVSDSVDVIKGRWPFTMHVGDKPTHYEVKDFAEHRAQRNRVYVLYLNYDAIRPREGQNLPGGRQGGILRRNGADTATRG